MTTHDQFAISFTQEEQIKKVELLLGSDTEEIARSHYKLCSQDQWNYNKAKNELSRLDWKSLLYSIDYRPFDKRYTVFDPNVAVHRRERLNSHMLKAILPLISQSSKKVLIFVM